jgi:membrane protein DedA with SNARE-associated domain
MLATAAIFSVSSGLGYLLPALIGLESMGVPSPGETALVLAAVLASQGKLDIWLVIVIAAASAITGDNIGYLLGRHFGREVLTSRGPFHERRAKVIAIGDRYFEKHGAKTVFIGRWVALIRFATAWLAGINGMRYSTFLFWNALSGSLWALAYGLAGYYGGNAVAHVLERVGIVAAGVLIALFIGAAVLVKLRERRAHRREEADAVTPAAAAETVAGAGDPAGSPAERNR